jgi:hypothetical protein
MTVICVALVLFVLGYAAYVASDFRTSALSTVMQRAAIACPQLGRA